MVDIKFPDDPRMQRLHESCEERAAAQKARGIDRRDNIDPKAPHLKTLTATELRMMTGSPASSVQVRLAEAIASIPDASLDALIAETERKMLGLPPPSDLSEVKLRPDGEMAKPITLPPETVRSFILRYGRAPTHAELRELVRGAWPK
jgi:hypothetical protein